MKGEIIVQFPENGQEGTYLNWEALARAVCYQAGYKIIEVIE